MYHGVCAGFVEAILGDPSARVRFSAPRRSSERMGPTATARDPHGSDDCPWSLSGATVYSHQTGMPHVVAAVVVAGVGVVSVRVDVVVTVAVALLRCVWLSRV